MVNPVVAKRIKMARCGADLSRGELADAISARIGKTISDELVRRIEVAERDVELGILTAIAAITGESIDWLQDGPTRPYVKSQRRELALAAGL